MKSKSETYVDSLLDGIPTVAVNSTSLSEKQQKFLEAYQANMGITKTALLSIGVTEETYSEWEKNETFLKALGSIRRTWVEQLRKAAYLRAQGKSDILLMFLLKALDPDTFDEDVRKQIHIAKHGPNESNTPIRATLVRDNTVQLFLNKSDDSDDSDD